MIAHLELIRPLFERRMCDRLLVTTPDGRGVVDASEIETIGSGDDEIYVFGALGTIPTDEVIFSQFDEATCEILLVTSRGPVTMIPLSGDAVVLA